ncbi:M23/M56 family metallopeptidase [uncultured Tenacibaculum sp.]|uniref:M23/M56 family metallopeptidase n=1 Tax=uncultured Tenacibaculum sp. TaxID=174713 RepID=UPI002611EC5D|nr:M23/M56 family metallopeptidase [uncultured Tenacibaculum sp.]
MNNIMLYLLQVTSIFSVLYLIYIVFLDKLTFHNLNRFVLLLLLPVSIIIPFSNILLPSIAPKIIEIPLFEEVNLNSFNKQLQVIEQPLIDSSTNYATIVLILYWFVFSVFFIRFLATIRHLFVLRSRSKIEQKNGYQLVISKVPQIFSYFNWVFIPEDKFEHYDKQIIEHEKVHIQLKHSWDVILSEVYILFFWFNPLLYFYRKSLKAVHEFQADKGVLQNGVKTSQYMQLLVQNLELSKPNNLYNYFNQHILKKRVTMMTKPKSNRLSKLTYILLLPICIFLISAFTSPSIKNNQHMNILDVTALVNKPPSLFPVQNASKKDITSYFGKNAKRPKNRKNIQHNGIDIRAKIGTPVLATTDGIIAKASMKGNWGNLIVITHSDGYETWYAHLNDFNVSKNQKVKKGDIIGYVGNTGLSTGPHLHYEVKQNGKPLNPLNFIE